VVKGERRRDIDLLKGLACAMMLVGHGFRIKLPELSHAGKVFLYIMDFSGPIFFLASGMNVITFLERNSHKTNFKMVQFYLLSAASLFFLGFAYNLNRFSLGFPDIFQCVALCTAIVFILLYLRIPSFWLIILALMASAVYWRWRMEITPGDEAFTSMGLIDRGLFCHFSLLPWVSFFLVGAVIYRVGTGMWEFVLGILFAAMFVGSFTMQPVFFEDHFQLMFRGVPYYVIQTTGGSGLLFLLARRFYHSPGKIPILSQIIQRFEYVGKESLLFLVSHWFILTIIHNLDRTMDPFLRAGLLLVFTFLALPFIAKARDFISNRPHYIAMMLSLLIFFFMITLVPLSAENRLVAHLLSYGASFSFAFVYPSLRSRIREFSTIKAPLRKVELSPTKATA